MRAIIALLVMANLLVLGWLYTNQDQYSAAPSNIAQPFPANVEPLVLLRERGDDAVSAQPGRPVDPVIAFDKARDAEPAPVATSDETTGEPETGPEDTVVSAADGDAVAAADAGTEAATVGDRGGENGGAAPSPGPVCHSIGPFSDRNPLDALVETLASADRPPAIRSAEMEQPSGYWVLLPAETRSAARAIVNQLAAKRVEDYFLGRDNVISLGIYSDKRMAERRVREISRLGYEPRLEPRFARRTVFWLDVDDATRASLDEGQWQALMTSQEGVESQVTACE